MMNIDLTKSQYDLDLLFEEAGRLGMDFGDLKEYGIENQSPNCGGKTCVDLKTIKSWDDAMNKGNKFTVKLVN